MKKILGLFIVPLLFLFTHSIVLPSLAQNDLPIKVKQPSTKTELPAFAADQIIVKFKPDLPTQAVEQLKNEHGATETRASKFGGGFVTLSFPEGSNVTEKAEIFQRNPLVKYAHPNFFAQAHFVPNDTIYCLQWHLDDSQEWDSTSEVCVPSDGNLFGGENGGGIGMEQAWDISTGSESVIVAVLDSGVAYEDYSDPNYAGCYDRFGQLSTCRPRIDEYSLALDLADTDFTILPGSDFVNSDDHPNDDDSHGTHVTGTVAQSTNNDYGVAGVVFDTTIMPVKVLDANGSGLFDEIADGIYFAVANGADVINMSLGGEFDASVLEDAVAYAFNSGVLVVTSAGNDFTTGNDTQYPAAYDDYVMAVGATRYDETRSYYSSTGPYVDVAAPGGDVTVDQNSDGYADGVLQETFETNADTSDFSFWFFQGTSMSAPHVSGLAALILSIDNNLTPTQVRNIIESTAEDKGTVVGKDDEYGWGIIDAYAALSSLVPAVAINVTDGAVEFGIVALGDTIDTTPAGTNDVQTIEVTTGPADLHIRSANFSDNGNTWALSETNGSNLVKWEFSKNAADWTTFATANTLYPLAANISQTSTQDVYFRLTMPSSTLSNNQHSSIVTIVASVP